ncbi:MAG: hypothetical protein US52_C0045G0018 [candidate division WS6 bacterium GW2011_GWA2_37_6]|uniref:DUF3800 domain-containing protein n=1 Tax=candidate division WS6 bacterium GW2011_GWA2_37_6 TaxID=1619087 RepID=A0A0G0GV02_9BACT|nr:MAG: hypothetical protein US52_C0045G0018 [candidate division WS6 bacterium GW2011_GWA2_37_6]
MLIFIDESGDAGFKISRGSTRFFVIALIIFDDELDAEETALKIKKLRRSIHKSDKYEFKFNRSSKEIRLKFLSCVKSCNFRIRAIVFDKEKIYSPELRKSKEKFYSYAIKSVLKNSNDTIKNAKVRIDGSGQRSFRRSLTVYLRKNLNLPNREILKNLRFRDSNKDVLIQLSDMIAGTIKRYYSDTKQDKREYYDIIKNKIEDLWKFK